MKGHNNILVIAAEMLYLTTRFRKRNWVAFMIVNISELEQGNGELYMLHGNLDIIMVQLNNVVHS